MNGYVDDGRIWCVYDIVSTEAASTLLYATTGITAIEIDGVSVSVAKTYLFSSTGEHLIKFTLGSSTTSIVQNQFYQVIRLKEIVTPSSITAIGQRAFYGCTGLTTISLPAVQTIAYQCFYNCTSLTGVLSLPSLTAFSGAASTGGEFYNTRFTKIVSLGTLAITRNQTFGGNTSLVSAELPSTITTLTQWTFYNDTALKYVICRAATPPSFDRAFQGCSSLSAIYVPKESVSAYQSASGWSSYSSIIFPIGDEKRLNINHLSLGDFRRRIMAGISTPNRIVPAADGKVWAYYNVTTTESATKLFNTTNGVPTTIIIDGSSVSRVTTYTFSSTGQHIVKFVPTSNYIGESTFRGCPALTEIYIPSRVTVIQSRAFQESTALSVVGGLDHIVTMSGTMHFYGCSSLAIEVDMPALTGYIVASFARTAITGVKNLGTITALGNSSDENGVFGFTPITYCNLPSTLVTMYQLLFQYCPNLHSLTIPASVTTFSSYWSPIGKSQITELICLGETPPNVTSTSFTTAAGLQSIKVPSNAVDTYKTATKWSNYADIISAIE